MNIPVSIRLILIALLIVIAGASLRIGAQAPSTSIRVIYTTDTLSYLEPCG